MIARRKRAEPSRAGRPVAVSRRDRSNDNQLHSRLSITSAEMNKLRPHKSVIIRGVSYFSYASVRLEPEFDKFGAAMGTATGFSPRHAWPSKVIANYVFNSDKFYLVYLERRMIFTLRESSWLIYFCELLRELVKTCCWNERTFLKLAKIRWYHLEKIISLSSIQRGSCWTDKQFS